MEIPQAAKFSTKKMGDHEERIVIEPCYPGYGLTLGNALRRVLLSSLEGVAVTNVKFDGVTHEFTTLPNVKEDILELTLNLKRLRFRLHGVERAQLRLEAKGKTKVKAKDISNDASVDVINPQAVIATLTDEKAELSCTITVERGRGYVPVEVREDRSPELGTIALDAIFTPVLNVSLKTEHVRVGQMTNFDRIILDVKTDGTVSPLDAVKESARLLIEQFEVIQDFGGENKSEQEIPQEEDDGGKVVADTTPDVKEEKKQSIKKSKAKE